MKVTSGGCINSKYIIARLRIFEQVTCPHAGNTPKQTDNDHLGGFSQLRSKSVPLCSLYLQKGKPARSRAGEIEEHLAYGINKANLPLGRSGSVTRASRPQ